MSVRDILIAGLIVVAFINTADISDISGDINELEQRISALEEFHAKQMGDDEAAARSVSGSGIDYVSAGHFGAGNYACTVSVSGNSDAYGHGHFYAISHGHDGSYGSLHAERVTGSYNVTTPLFVGDHWPAHVPEGEVWFEVSAKPQAKWEITCK